MKANIPETDKPRIVIVGCGFGGLKLAKKLKNIDYQVVIIDKNNHHQFQPLLYQVATSGLEPSSIAFPIRKIFREFRNFHFRMAELKEIHTTEKYITTDIGRINYDILVLATGVTTNYFGNHNFMEKTIPMKSVSEALYLRNSILKDFENALTEENYNTRQKFLNIAIVGGGPTGVELAGALAEMKKFILVKEYAEIDVSEIDIYLLQGAECLLYGMSRQASENALKYLTHLGVHVKLNSVVKDYDGQFLETSSGEKIEAGKVIWAAGVTGQRIKGIPDSCYVGGSRLATDRFNRIKGLENVYAIGDMAYMEEEKYPKGHPQLAQVAMQQAKNLAYNLTALKLGKPLHNFSYKNHGVMATVGRNLAVADLPLARLKGFVAWLIWLFVHLMALIGIKNKVFVFFNWLWNYVTYDQSLRLIIKPFVPKRNDL